MISGILEVKEHTAILEVVDSGEGSGPESSTHNIPYLCVNEGKFVS